MTKVIRHIAFCLFAAVCLVSCHRSKVIPRSTMVDIYADMFIADQWLQSHSEYYRQADTTRFYEPIFEKYGYNTEDFRNSASYYLKDPRRYSRILQRTVTKLSEQKKEIENLRTDIDQLLYEISEYKLSSPVVKKYFDSLFFARSSGFCIELYLDSSGVYLPDFYRDTIAVRDTSAVRDTVSEAPHKHKLREGAQPKVISYDVVWK